MGKGTEKENGKGEIEFLDGFIPGTWVGTPTRSALDVFGEPLKETEVSVGYSDLKLGEGVPIGEEERGRLEALRQEALAYVSERKRSLFDILRTYRERIEGLEEEEVLSPRDFWVELEGEIRETEDHPLKGVIDGKEPRFRLAILTQLPRVPVDLMEDRAGEIARGVGLPPEEVVVYPTRSGASSLRIDLD